MNKAGNKDRVHQVAFIYYQLTMDIMASGSGKIEKLFELDHLTHIWHEYCSCIFCLHIEKYKMGLTRQKLMGITKSIFV